MVGYWQDERKHLIVNSAFISILLQFLIGGVKRMSGVFSLILYLFNIIQKRIFAYLGIHQKATFMLSTKFKV